MWKCVCLSESDINLWPLSPSLPLSLSIAVCKSCLVKHLEENNTCPACDMVIHQSHPLQYISFDRTMQDIVYKLVPNLQEGKRHTRNPKPTLTKRHSVNVVNPIHFISTQTNWHVNVISIKIAIYQIQKIYHKTPMTTHSRTKVTPIPTIIDTMNK